MIIIRGQAVDNKHTTLNIDTTFLKPGSKSIATVLKWRPVALVKATTIDPKEYFQNGAYQSKTYCDLYDAASFVRDFKYHEHNMSIINKTWMDPYSEKIIIDLAFYGIKDEKSTIIYHPIKSNWYRAFFLHWYTKSFLTNIKEWVWGIARELPGCIVQEMRDAKQRKLSQNMQQLGSSTQEFWLLRSPKKGK